jgi:signal transduction histidine kinase
MVGLALLVSVIAIAVHTGLAVRAAIDFSAERTRAAAQQVALLATRAASATPEPADTLGNDPALAALFESALAGDPTLFDLGVFDTRGRALAHSTPEVEGSVRPRRPILEELESGFVPAQALRLLGPPQTYDVVVPLRADRRAFGEVRVGVSSALIRAQLIDSLRAGAWVMAAALVLAILVGLGFAHVISQRVRTVMTGLERLREGQFGYRLAVEGQDELALLASSINALGERLEATRARAAAGEMDEEELLRATGQISAWARVVSGLAHELADPLNAAALHLGHLKRKWKAPTPEASKHLGVLEDELKRLERIVLGFRRFSILGEMRPEWFDLDALLVEVVERARDMRLDRRFDIRLQTDGIPERFFGDPSLLRQALSNLIANAQQAMPGGGQVTLAARRSPGGVELSVIDEGVGIAEDLQSRVFDLYFTTKETGSGIGLAVVRQVIQLHGGRVRLRSTPGEGTQVTLELPVRIAQTVGVG